MQNRDADPVLRYRRQCLLVGLRHLLRHLLRLLCSVNLLLLLLTNRTGVVWVTTKSILVGSVATAAPLGLRWCSRALLLDEAGVP